MKKVIINDEVQAFDLKIKKDNRVEFIFNDKLYSFSKSNCQGESFSLKSKDGESSKIWNSAKSFVIDGVDFNVEKFLGNKSSQSSHVGEMKSPMPGKILKIYVGKGDQVEKGSPVVVMEAMKMEHTITAACSGTISDVLCLEGDLVEGDKQLINIEETSK